jgi:hypothetical protein
MCAPYVLVSQISDAFSTNTWPEKGHLALGKVPGLLKMFSNDVLIKQSNPINDLLIYFDKVVYLLHAT